MATGEGLEPPWAVKPSALETAAIAAMRTGNKLNGAGGENSIYPVLDSVNILITLAFTVSLHSGIPAITFVFTSVSFCLAVTIRTK